MLLVGAAALILTVVLLGAAVHIRGEAGAGVFLWPRLEHPHERYYAARLAALPWLLLLFLAVLNALAILLFSEDLLGNPPTAITSWLVACAVAVLMIHLLDYRHSPVAAVLTLVLVAGAALLLASFAASPVPLLLAAPLLLWSFNGVRATIADRIYG